MPDVSVDDEGHGDFQGVAPDVLEVVEELGTEGGHEILELDAEEEDGVVVGRDGVEEDEVPAEELGEQGVDDVGLAREVAERRDVLGQPLRRQEPAAGEPQVELGVDADVAVVDLDLAMGCMT